MFDKFHSVLPAILSWTFGIIAIILLIYLVVGVGALSISIKSLDESLEKIEADTDLLARAVNQQREASLLCAKLDNLEGIAIEGEPYCVFMWEGTQIVVPYGKLKKVYDQKRQQLPPTPPTPQQ